ncbi:MAG TPA: alpha/beta hydrolase [Ktedonobacterales bacterium]|nr:alpha/beta hydrolase [Ktedonobacterales bacterium]
MPVDEQVQKVLERYAAFGAPPLVRLSPQEARQRPTIRDAVNALRRERGEVVVPEAVSMVRDEMLQGPEGEIGVRLYRPEASGPLPMLVYFHGGGWVLGNLESSDATCRALANLTRCLVISVGYRLAPEHRFPAAVQDAYAAMQWARENAARLGGDATRLAVGGEDAGGNLAAVVTLMARDSQMDKPLYQVLIYPILDDAFSTPSYEHNAYVRPLTRDEMRWFWGYYLPKPAAGANEYASPLRAEDMRDLPPGLIVTAEFDVVRDEAEAYGGHLEAAGVPMAMRRRAGMVHGFLDMAPVVREARKGLEEIADWLRVAFYPPSAEAGAEGQTRQEEWVCR